MWVLCNLSRSKNMHPCSELGEIKNKCVSGLKILERVGQIFFSGNLKKLLGFNCYFIWPFRNDKRYGKVPKP